MMLRAALVLLCLLVMVPQAFAADIDVNPIDIFKEEIRELQREIAMAELYGALPIYESAFDAGKCKQHIDDAKRELDAAEALNRKFKSSPTPAYQKDMSERKARNARAIYLYKNCFNEEIRASSLVRASLGAVFNYQTFMAKKAELTERYGQASDLGTYITQLKGMLISLQATGSIEPAYVGIITSVSGNAEVNRLGGRAGLSQSAWRPLKKGTSVKVGDHIKTGTGGAIQITVLNTFEKFKSGPSGMYLGENSYLVMTDFLTQAQNDFAPKTTGVAWLLTGMYRMVTGNWGKDSNFRVISDASICDIRGTDITIVRNRQSDTVEYLLGHGTVRISAPGGKTLLQPQRKLTVSAGRIGAPASLGAEDQRRLKIGGDNGMLIKR